jgi:hypothetical protein
MENLSESEQNFQIINNIFNTINDDDRITYIFYNNRIRYNFEIHETNKYIDNNYKIRINFKNQKELLKAIYLNKINYIKLLEIILKKKKIQKVIYIILAIFRNCEIDYNNTVINILTHEQIKLNNIKDLMLNYSKNHTHDILLWNYLINNILMYETECNITYWTKIYKNCINDINFYDLFMSFLYCKDIINPISSILLINGKYETFLKINNIYKIKFQNIKKILLKSLKNFKIHNSYKTIKYLIDKINTFDNLYAKEVIQTFYTSNFTSLNITIEEDMTIRLLHKKFKNKYMLLTSFKYNKISIPMYLLEYRKPSLSILKFLHTKRTVYMVDQYSIYHIISNMNFNLYTDDEIFDILTFYISNLNIPFLYFDKINMSPLAYLIENISIKIPILQFYLKYETLQTYKTIPNYDEDYSQDFTYILLTNPNITLIMMYELIENKIIDVKKINEKGENIAMMYMQNINIFCKKKNDDTISIYRLLLSYIDLKHVDINGNNIMFMICSIDNPELVKQLIPLFGFNLLNISNNNGLTPLIKLANNIYNNGYLDSEEILEWLIDMEIELKFNIDNDAANKKISIFEYITNTKIAQKIVKYMILYDEKNLYNFINRDNIDSIMLMSKNGIFNYNIYKLLESSINYNIYDENGNDIFLLTCEFGYYKVLKNIINKININYKNNNNENALHVVCYRDNDLVKEKIIKLLLSSGINYTVRDNVGNLFYNLLYRFDTIDKKIFNILIKEKYIDIDSDMFIQFVIINDIAELKKKYDIKIKEIIYTENIDDCIICKDEIKNEDKFYLCSESGIKHIYHKDCLDTWINHSKRTNCLLCMKEIFIYKGYYLKK